MIVIEEIRYVRDANGIFMVVRYGGINMDNDLNHVSWLFSWN
jgi:hypothetical protein